MKLRECVEFLIFPKFVRVLAFYTKGHYSLLIKVCHEDEQGKVVFGYPQLMEGKDAVSVAMRKAFVEIEGEAKYQTEQFYINYNQQSIILNSLCIFKLQYEVGKQYKTYIDIELIYTKFKTQRDQKSQKIINVKKATICDKRRLYINRHQHLNHFKRLVFSESEYFSYADFYIASASLGQKIRLNPYQLSEFIKMSNEEKLEFHGLAEIQWIDNAEKKGEVLRSILSKDEKESRMSSLYEELIVKAIKQYERIVGIRNGYLTRINNSSSGLNIQKKNIPILMCIEDYKDELNLLNYYGHNTENNIIYWNIYEEYLAYLINVIHIWQNLSELLLKINLTVFQDMSSHQISNQLSIIKTIAVTHGQIDVTRVQSKNNFIHKRKQQLKKALIYEQDDEYHPLLMIEGLDHRKGRFEVSPNIESLTIFIHGYQGSDYDLEKAKNFMNIYNSSSYGLLIKTLQDQEGLIEQLGIKLSDQIKTHIQNAMNDYKRINFVGYSLGGVLARQALKHLTQYKDRMNLFISFASPHLGIRNSDNALVATGIWYMVNVGKVRTMAELHMESLNNEISTLQKLSECQGLGWFKKIVLVSSQQDCFVPYYSSRLDEVVKDDLIVRMCRQLRSRIKKIERVDVWFDVDHITGTLDRMLGRKSHIQFLQNRIFLDSFFRIYAPYL